MTRQGRGCMGLVLPAMALPMPCRAGRRLVQGLSILLVAWVGVASAEPKRVLIVHSLGSASPPFATDSVAFEIELTEKLGSALISTRSRWTKRSLSASKNA